MLYVILLPILNIPKSYILIKLVDLLVNSEWFNHKVGGHPPICCKWSFLWCSLGIAVPQLKLWCLKCRKLHFQNSSFKKFQDVPFLEAPRWLAHWVLHHDSPALNYALWLLIMNHFVCKDEQHLCMCYGSGYFASFWMTVGKSIILDYYIALGV